MATAFDGWAGKCAYLLCALQQSRFEPKDVVSINWRTVVDGIPVEKVLPAVGRRPNEHLLVVRKIADLSKYRGYDRGENSVFSACMYLTTWNLTSPPNQEGNGV